MEVRRAVKGQMTIEFLVMLPVMLIIAVIAMNALSFFSDCAAFDRVACESVRAYASSPSYGEGTDRIRGQVNAQIERSLKSDYSETEVQVRGDALGLVTYTAVLSYSPNLFGMGMRSEILGVSLPKLKHSVELTLSPYKPGVFL